MRRPSRSRVVLTLAVAALFVTPAAALGLPGQSQSAAQQTTVNASANESIEPGAQFAGVVGVGQAEVDGAVEGRAFGQAVAAANNNRSKAAVTADHVARMEARLTELQQRRDALRAAFENGSIDRGPYQARTATLAARIEQVQRGLNRTQTVATALPEQARTRGGLNVQHIETLRSQAHQLGGGEVAQIARGIAGRHVGSGISDMPRGGPPAGVPGNWTRGPGANGPGGGMNGPGGGMNGPGSGGSGTNGPGSGMNGSGGGGPPTDAGSGQRDNRTSDR